MKSYQIRQTESGVHYYLRSVSSCGLRVDWSISRRFALPLTRAEAVELKAKNPSIKGRIVLAVQS